MTETIASYTWVALGSALGGAGRFWLSGLLARHYGETFPLGTLFVNVSGSFLIGLAAALGEPEGRFFLKAGTRSFLMIGLLGGYTTFSSFSLQTLNLARDGEWLHASANVLLSVALCLAAVWAGHMIGEALNR